jgi:hypothetical protein
LAGQTGQAVLASRQKEQSVARKEGENCYEHRTGNYEVHINWKG